MRRFAARAIDNHIRRRNQALADLLRSGRLREARAAFDAIPDGECNVVTWNSMIAGHVRARDIAEARRLFDRMPHRDLVSWNSMLAGYALLASTDPRGVEDARRFFDHMPQRDVVSWNTMIAAYSRSRRMDDAMQLFGRMPEGNVVTWNTIITGFLNVGNVARAVELFERMPVRDAASLSGLVSGMVRNNKLEEAERIVLKSCTLKEVQGVVDAYNTLIAGYGQNGRVDDARRIFDLIPQHEEIDEGMDRMTNKGKQKKKRVSGGFVKNVVSWNSMIMCYIKAEKLPSARELFDAMSERDLVSWNTMVLGYTQALLMDDAESLFQQMPDPDAWTWNSMIHGFIHTGNIERAREFFDRMPLKSLVSWNTMIAGYEQNGDYEIAIKLFIQMQETGEKPDRHTLSSVLSSCSGLATLHLGAQIHQLVTKTTLADTPINNALITMYSRCGSVIDAKSIFNGMGMKMDVVSWNAMIGGYAQHGQATEALELFKEMKRRKVSPTHITFIAVLNACGHAGLVAEGRSEFNSMVREFGITPRVEHYATLVDLIGRYGQLEDAMKVINSMTVKPDRAVWGALLGAARVHNNPTLAHVAAEALVDLEPENSAPYVLLHNMHVDEGKWDNAIEIRRKMDKQGVIKQPGYSWIEMHDKVEVFLSGDMYHPLSHEILTVLNICNRDIRDMHIDS